MILKYVLKSFSRRKVRTILMILSLLVSTGLIVTMSTMGKPPASLSSLSWSAPSVRLTLL